MEDREGSKGRGADSGARAEARPQGVAPGDATAARPRPVLSAASVQAAPAGAGKPALVPGGIAVSPARLRIALGTADGVRAVANLPHPSRPRFEPVPQPARGHPTVARRKPGLVSLPLAAVAPGAAEDAIYAPMAALPDRRRERAPRRRTLLSGKIVYNESRSVQNCTVRDMSTTGAKLVFGIVPNCPRVIDLVLHNGVVRHCEVVYRRETTMGVRFLGVEAG
jgi:hypothetical protein